MGLPRILGIALFIFLASCPPLAGAQGSILDTQLEVSTALAQSSLTDAAIKKDDDAKIRAAVAQRDKALARRDALAARVKAGEARNAALVAANAVLVTANEALVAAVADNDRSYKAAIDGRKRSRGHIRPRRFGRLTD
jgi:hypothetical protein